MTRVDSQQEVIQANNFGGLNTTSSPINASVGDARTLRNADIDISGKIVKRKGTRLLHRSLDKPLYSVHSFRTYNSIELFVVFRNEDMFIYDDDGTSVLRSFNDVIRFQVFSPGTPDYLQYPTQLVIPDDILRIVYLFRHNAPVQLTVLEYTVISDGTTNQVIPNTINSPLTTTSFVYINGVRDPSVSVIYSGSSGISVIFSVAPPAGATIVVLTMTAQRWVEAELWYGDRFLQHVPRGTASPADRVILIPRELRSDLPKPIRIEAPFVLYSSNLPVPGGVPGIYTNQYLLVTNSPSTVVQYDYHDGTLYTSGTTQTIPTKNFIAFGDYNVSHPNAYIVRHRRCKFNDGQGAQAQYIKAFVNSNDQSPGYAHQTTYNSAWFHKLAPVSSEINTLPVDLINWYAFVSENKTDNRLNLSATSQCTIYNNENRWAGAGLLNNVYPVYGLGYFANYANGDFPSIGIYANGRVYLSGISGKPGTVIASGVSDFYTPNLGKFNFFQITDDLLGTDSDPFDIVLDEPVVGLRQWQQFVFIFTEQAVYRLDGRQLTLISSLGALSNNAIAVTENIIYYIGYGGLYAIPLVQQTEYRSEEVSIKIRDFFKEVYRGCALRYVPSEYRLYVALDTKNQYYSDTLLVYDLVRLAWCEYYSYVGFQIWTMTVLSRKLVVSCITTVYTGIIQFGYDKYLDHAVSHPTRVAYTQPEIVPLVANKTRYQITTYVSPDLNEQDIAVYLNNTVLSFNTQWRKNSDRSITLLTSFLPSDVLRVYPKPRSTWYGFGVYLGEIPTGVYSDTTFGLLDTAINSYTMDTVNVCLSLSDDKLVDIGQTDCVIAPIASDVEIGYVYPSEFGSILFTSETLFRRKRLEQVYIIIDNDVQYIASDSINDLGQFQTQLYSRSCCPLSAKVSVCTEADTTVFDVRQLFNVQSTFKPWTLFKESIQSVGYSHQLVIWSNDVYSWSLGGFQLSVSILSNSSYVSGES